MPDSADAAETVAATDPQTPESEAPTGVSSPDTEAAEQPAEQPDDEAPTTTVQQPDPEAEAARRREILAEAKRLHEQWKKAEDRRREKAEELEIAQSQDAEAALRNVERRAAQPIEPVGPDVPEEWRQRAAQAAPFLAPLLARPEYQALHDDPKTKAELDRRYGADPVAFAQWLDDKILDIRAEKRAGPRAEALALDKANRALKGVPVPPAGGGGGGGGLTLERYQAMSPEEAARLAPADIDRLMAAALNRR